jgi:hypothetical protein
MSNVYLLNASKNLVTLGNVFTTENNYLFKQPVQYSKDATFAFTRTLLNSDLRVFRETLDGITISNFTQIVTRESLPPDVPTKGPFIENYSVEGTLNTNSFINLLLVDKPPIRTGYFQFFIGGISFTGLITRQTPYEHYNWQQTGTKYSYVKQSQDLGYGIEISQNLLYTAELIDGEYVLTPTALLDFLNSLTGNEEIISTATSEDPNAFLNSIPGLPSYTFGSLPISLFYISPADALRYIASYEDLILAFGSDFEAGQQHYATQRGDRTITFDPISYLNKYSDLRSLYGYDTYSATVHYITTGFFEGRTATGGSSADPLVGGLYDERNGSISLDENLIIWPLGETLAASGLSIEYKYNNKNYFLNGSYSPNGNLLYLGVQ